jgi:protein involved in polysaccharide export with SLBB domain
VAPAAFATIGAGDVIAIQAFHCEEISREWRVNDAGEVNLPMIGRLKASGRTARELEQVIGTQLSKFVLEAQVSITVVQVYKFPVTVTGGVDKPGPLLMHESQTLFDALVLSGGPKNAGKRVTLTRTVARGTIPLPGLRKTVDGRFWVCDIELADLVRGRTGAASLTVKEDDLINFEVQEPRLVHIIGEVSKPGSVELIGRDTVSLLKVVAVAGGLTRLASPGKVIIRRVGDEGARVETAVVDLKMVMSGRAGDLELSAGDVVIVPSSNFKAYMQTATSAALTSGIFAGMQVLAQY